MINPFIKIKKMYTALKYGEIYRAKFSTEKTNQFIDHLTKHGFRREGSGGSRIGFRRNKIIIKVPHSVYGLIDNQLEYDSYLKYRHGFPSGMLLAPCHLMSNGCLMMRLVDRKIDRSVPLPDWAVCIDGTQVGYYNNKLVAFDYAHDVPDRYTERYHGSMRLL